MTHQSNNKKLKHTEIMDFSNHILFGKNYEVVKKAAEVVIEDVVVPAVAVAKENMIGQKTPSIETIGNEFCHDHKHLKALQY